VGQGLEEQAVQRAQLAIPLRPDAGLPHGEREREAGPRVPDLPQIRQRPPAALRAQHGAIADPERGRRAIPDRIRLARLVEPPVARDRKSTRLNSSHVKKSYAVFCLKKKMVV